MTRRQILFVALALSLASMRAPALRGQAPMADPPAGPALESEPKQLEIPGDPPAGNTAQGENPGVPGDAPQKAKTPPRRDGNVERMEGATPSASPTTPSAPAATAPAAPAGSSAPPPDTSADNGNSINDRILVGKQEVSVSVQVTGPADLNLNKPAPFKIIVKNTGTADAFQVFIRDELPPGLAHVSSEPPANVVSDSLLTWMYPTLRAGEQRVIQLQLKPTAKGALDHVATATFKTGSKSRTHIHEPRLKVEQTLSSQKVLKGQNVEFRIGIRNTGDGPARDVVVTAKLSPGLRHESGSQPNEDTVYEILIPEIAPGQTEPLDPLVVDTTQAGEQWCLVKASSPDVEPHPEDAEYQSKLEVVEPLLRMNLTGPAKRFTETIAPYRISVENPGSAPAKNVVVVASLQLDGLLVKVPPNAEYDKQRRRLIWTFPEIRDGEKLPELGFEVKMQRIGRYNVTADAKADGALRADSVFHTEVEGMADIRVDVLEIRRYVDVGGVTDFTIRLRNYGKKDANRLKVVAKVSENLEIDSIRGGPGTNDTTSKGRDRVDFTEIEHLGANKEINLGILVKAKSDKPRRAYCRVEVTHDDFTEPVEGTRDITVTNSRELAPGP